MNSLDLIIKCVIVTIIFYLTNCTFPDFKPLVKCDRLYSNSVKDSVFVKLQARGFSYRVIVISQDSKREFEPDSTKDFIFKGFSAIYYKMDKDTLIVYTPLKVKAPMGFMSKIRVRQIELKNPEMMNLRDKYINLGLKKME
jgi:hypothetical protein